MAKDVVYTPKKGPLATTPQELERRILERIEKENLPLTYLGFLGEYRGFRTKVAFECTCGRRPNKSVKNFLCTGSVCGCRQTKYAHFKRGDVHLYVMRAGEIGKVGVTCDLLRRRQELNLINSLEFEIEYALKFDQKQDAFDRERFIKKILGAGGCGDLKEGYTETFPYSVKTLNNIKNLSRVGSVYAGY
ncbi:hypothetical protein AHT88_03290 [Salmonella enterica subsp. enterica serovar Muenchen]|nr:hypothetical protein [Salmonella enterica subsp. enterica serovar Muenchen]